jgi:hypothetical protein
MKVKALISFVGYDPGQKKYRVVEGEEFELPAGVDWLAKGLVVEVAPQGEAKAKVEAKGKAKR